MLNLLPLRMLMGNVLYMLNFCEIKLSQTRDCVIV